MNGPIAQSELEAALSLIARLRGLDPDPVLTARLNDVEEIFRARAKPPTPSAEPGPANAVLASGVPSTRLWFDTKQAAEYCARHPQTIRKAAEAGELHGTQRKMGGRWRFHRDCLDRFSGGQSCPDAELPH